MDRNLLNFDEIRKQIDIVQVIGSYLPLTKRGKSYLAVCPFHDDSNPSMNISSEKQIFKCFACGASGNVFTFIRDYEHIPFMSAVRKAAEISGVDIPELKREAYQSTNTAVNEPLYKVVDEISQYYEFQLKVAEGVEALDYLKNRQLEQATIEKFRIGFSPDDGQKSIRFLQNKGHSLDSIITSGIGMERDGVVYDRMAGRVVFPLQDEYGRVIGFSGRRLNEGLEQKYLNTPETAIFHKSHCLYHFHLAEKAARRAGKIYILEGFMDVIALDRVGIEHSVATMGTALTSEHLSMLRKINAELILALDNDKPGQMATFRALDLLQETNLKIKVIKVFAEGKDLDELVNTQDKETVLAHLEQVQSPFDFRIDYLAKDVNFENFEDRKAYVVKVLSYFKKFRFDDYDSEYYLQRLSQISGFRVEVIRKNLEPMKAITTTTSNRLKSKQQMHYINRYEMAERQMIHLMLKDPLVVAKVQYEAVFMYYEVYRKIMSCILNEYNINGQIVLADALNDLEPTLRNELIAIDEGEFPPMEFVELVKIIKDEFPKHLEFSKLEEQISELSDPKEQAKLAQQLIATKQQFAALKRTTNRNKGGAQNEGKKEDSKS